MKKQLLRTTLLLFALIAGSTSTWAAWERVTNVSTLTTGGTFIIGYEATANSGIIIPMANTGSATTSTAGFMYSGSTATSGGSETIDMSSVATTTAYEVEIGASSEVDGAIYIKVGSNYLGNTNTKNNCKLFAEQANTTSFTPTFGSNDNVTLDIAANNSGSKYRYLKYNTGSPRFAVYSTAPDKIVIYKKVGGASVCATPTFSPGAGALISAKNVTISCDTEGATIYYTTNGDDPTTGSSVYSAPIAVSANTTIKALAAKTGYTNSTIASAAYTFPTTTYNSVADLIAAAPTEAVILNLTNAQVLGVGAKDMYVKDASEGIDFYNLGLTYTAGQILNGKVVVTGYSLYNGMPEITGIGENQIVASAGTLPAATVLANASDATLENYKWKFVTVTGPATDTRKIDGLTIFNTLLNFNNLIANVDNVTASGLIIPYKKGADPIIPELLPTSLIYNITLSKDMVTYCSTNKLDYSGTGLKVYSAKVTGTAAELTEIENAIVTAEKGIILSGTAGQTYNVPVTAANATSISGSELVGVKAETAVAYSANSKYNYILQNGVFKKATGAKLKAGKAYLSTTFDVTASGAPELKIVFDGGTTGINAVQGSEFKVNGQFYDLQGRKVATPTKGLYIVNGRKVIVK